jgi:hypothetical protein
VNDSNIERKKKEAWTGKIRRLDPGVTRQAVCATIGPEARFAPDKTRVQAVQTHDRSDLLI